MTDPTLAIERLIPHRLPMRMVEQVDEVDEQSIEASATVRASWPTAEHGFARTLVLIELIAQSAAALQGWRERHESAVGRGGLLVGVPSATLTAPAIPVGTPLHCKVTISHGVQSYLAFEGTVTGSDGTVWATASIQAFRPSEEENPAGSP